MLSCVFWHKYTKQYHFANVKFPGRKHTLHVNSCPDHSRGRRTAELQVSISSQLRCSNEDTTRKKPHTPEPSVWPLHVQSWLVPPQPRGLNNSSKTCGAQSRRREMYVATGLGELPTHRVLGLRDGLPRLPAEGPLRAACRGL